MGDPWAARRNPPSHKDTRISGSLEFCKQTRPGLGWCIWPQGATVRSIGGFNPKGKFDCWEHEDLPANLGGSLFSGEKNMIFRKKKMKKHYFSLREALWLRFSNMRMISLIYHVNRSPLWVSNTSFLTHLQNKRTPWIMNCHAVNVQDFHMSQMGSHNTDSDHCRNIGNGNPNLWYLAILANLVGGKKGLRVSVSWPWKNPWLPSILSHFQRGPPGRTSAQLPLICWLMTS